MRNLKSHPAKFIAAGLVLALGLFFILRPKQKDLVYKTHIALPGFQSSALVILAHEKGFFRDEGVDATLEYKALGRDCLALVVAGKADLAVVFETPITRSILEGNDISVLTEVHRSELNTAIVARKDRGILQAKHLQGKIVASVAKTNAEFHLDLFLRSHMIDPEKIEIKQLSVNEVLDALAQGKVDAAALWEPYVSQSISKDPTNFVLLRSSFYSEFSMLAGLHTKLQGKQEENLAVVRALIRAQLYFDSENAEARKIVERILLKKNFFVSPIAWDQMDVQLGLSATLLTMFNVEADWYRSLGAASGPAKLDHIFIGSHLKRLAPELVTYE